MIDSEVLFASNNYFSPFLHIPEPQVMTDNLDLIYRYCVYHLDSVNNKIPDVHFEFDGTQKWLCSRSLPKPLSFSFSVDPITDAPLIFQVIGQISERKEPVVNQHFQEIWIEGRSDAASRALWSHIPDSLNAISEAAHLSFNLSKLFEVDDHSGVVRLRVVWTPTQANNVSCAALLV